MISLSILADATEKPNFNILQFNKVQKMDIYKAPFLSKEDEKLLWQNAILVLDTSAICGLYDLTDHYRQIMVSILSCLKDRIWIPNQVKVEYLRNRVKGINNPKSERYTLPSIVNDRFVVEVRELVRQWESNQYFHPFLNEDKLQLVKKEIEEANTHIRIVKETITNQYKLRQQEIDEISEDDALLDFVNTLSTGAPLDFATIMAIMKEGDFRYRNLIPPGYCDKDKSGGVRKYGDLIIWKGIIDYARTNQKDIIYISNDLKADWVYQEGKHKGLPLTELLAEFNEETNQKIWFYSTLQLIDQLKIQYKDTHVLPLFDELENVEVVLRRIALERVREHSAQGEKIILKCASCGHEFEIWSDELDFEWDCGTTEERRMGEEIGWHAEGSICCPECKEQIDVTIDAYEYPMGVYNYGDIDCENGAILNKPDIESMCPIKEYYEDMGYCHRCGELAELNEYGLCEMCEDEFNRFVNSDD